MKDLVTMIERIRQHTLFNNLRLKTKTFLIGQKEHGIHN